MIQKDSLVINEKDLLELMRQAFEEGYKGYQESRDSVVYALFNAWKSTYKPTLNASSKWAIAQAATDEPSLRHLQGRVRNALSAAQQDEINRELQEGREDRTTIELIDTVQPKG